MASTAARKAFNPRYLIISLGNPAPYENTLHSAGHHMLNHVQRLLAPSQPPFTKSSDFGKVCEASIGKIHTMVKSPVSMNISGDFAKSALRRTRKASIVDPDNIHLIFVHDDLEENLGVVKMRKWMTSHRGHNGIKSIKKSVAIEEESAVKWCKISIGIGRPVARDKPDVSEYVLSPMTEKHHKAIEAAAPRFLDVLNEWESYLTLKHVEREEQAAFKAQKALAKVEAAKQRTARRAIQRAEHKARRKISMEKAKADGQDPEAQIRNEPQETVRERPEWMARAEVTAVEAANRRRAIEALGKMHWTAYKIAKESARKFAKESEKGVAAKASEKTAK